MGLEIGYSCHIFDKNGIYLDPGKIIALKEFPVLKTQKNSKQFLGSATYYHRFIERFSETDSLVNQLLKVDTLFVWTDEQQIASDISKEK